MIIDNAINEVYQRDKKVFIPEFGAIIYSEFNDTIDFNDLLTFDDGKVISEIQRQQNGSEEEASNALNDYVQDIKELLTQGNAHFFGGIGYLFKDDQGSFSISKTKPNLHIASAEKSSDLVSEDTTENQGTSKITKNKSKGSTQKERKKKKNQGAETREPTDQEEPAAENVPPEVVNQSISEEAPEEDLQEHNYQYSSEPEHDDEIKQFSNEEEHSGKNNKRRPAQVVLGVALLLLVLAIPVYYFIIKADGTVEKGQESGISALSSQQDPVKNDSEHASIPANNAEKESTGDHSTSIKVEAPEQAAKQPESPQSSTDLAPGKDKIYSLILGSFKIERNADKFERWLDGKGLEVSKFRRGNSFYFVGIEQIKGKSNAVKLLAELREEEEPTAWIIKKR